MADDRSLTKNAAGEQFDLSAADTFDFATFYGDMQDAERLQVSRDELSWVQNYQKPDEPVDVVLNMSCGVQTVPHVMLLQAALFEALDVNFVATAGTQFCCGRVYQRFGNTELGDRLAAKAISKFGSWEPDVNVQCCGSCFIEFDYHVTKAKEETGTKPFEVVHITRFLLDRLRELGDAVPWQASEPARPIKVLLHAEGAELHATKEVQRNDVITTLGLIPGVEFVGLTENPSLGSPCASKGPGEPSVLNDITDEQYRLVLAELREQTTAAGADAIVTHHHFCHREWSKFGTAAVPVIHYQSLLADALGRHVPDRFQALWHLRDPERVLEHTRPQWSSWGIGEEHAREIVRKHFVPRYASSLQRCPCEGSCHEAVAGTHRPDPTVCGTSLRWDAPTGAA